MPQTIRPPAQQGSPAKPGYPVCVEVEGGCAALAFHTAATSLSGHGRPGSAESIPNGRDRIGEVRSATDVPVPHLKVPSLATLQDD